MDTTIAAPASATAGLLETVTKIRAEIGDALDNEEFTVFIASKKLPAECGFRFMCFHDDWVTLHVPPQNETQWHDEAGRWIPPAQEQLAKTIAKKHKLMLFEPPDDSTLFAMGSDTRHHHIRFSDHRDTVIIAHPELLKIRLYSSERHLVRPRIPGLLHDLSLLYQNRASGSRL